MSISEKRKKDLENMVCIQQFKKAIKEKIVLGELDISDNSINDYSIEIDLFFRQLGIAHNQKPTIEQCLTWKEQYIKRYAKKTMGKKIVAINLYLKLVCEYQQSIPQIKNISRAKKPIVLSREQIMNMIDFAESNSKYTEATMIFLGFITACRNSVLLDLKLSDLDFERNIVSLRGCKGDLDLKVPMAKSDMQRIKQYVELYRPKAQPEYEQYLFLGRSGKSFYRIKLLRTMEYCAVHCGIREKVHPHVLRHSRVKDLRNQGYSWEEIMTITGHKNLSSLSSYIHEESFDIVQEKLNNGDNPPSNAQNTSTDLLKEVELLKLKLQLAEKENENLNLQLHKDNPESTPKSLNADRIGYA